MPSWEDIESTTAKSNRSFQYSYQPRNPSSGRVRPLHVPEGTTLPIDASSFHISDHLRTAPVV
jgi:hypothetical protein